MSTEDKRELPDRVDVAIVGAGLGGLVAGVCLARAGLRVACFEHHFVAGGCASQFARTSAHGRFRFDVGVHYVGDCGEEGAVQRFLRELGAPVDFAPMDPDGFDTLVFPDFTFRIPADVERYRSRLVESFPREVAGIDRYLRALRAVMGAESHTDPLVAGIHRHTIGAFVGECTSDVRLRAVLLGQTGDYALPPSQASAVMHLGLAGHYFRGGWYPKGGGQVLPDRLVEAFEAEGGALHLRQGVERIWVERHQAVGVRLECGAEVRARVVLSNADVKATLLQLVGPEHLPGRWVKRLPELKMSGAMFYTFLGVRGDLAARGMRRTNLWQFDDYDLESLCASVAPVATRSCYLGSASVKDPDSHGCHAPPGFCAVEVMTQVPAVGPAWSASSYEATKAAVEEQLIARFDRLFPGARDAIVFRESATPVTFQRYTRATDGACFGLASTPEQYLDGRPDNRAALPGLYFAGASTRAGHGVWGAMQSGQRAARCIAQDLKVSAPEPRLRPG